MTTESSSRFIIKILRQIISQGFLPGTEGVSCRPGGLRQIKTGIGGPQGGAEYVRAGDGGDFAGNITRLPPDLLGELKPGCGARVGKMVKARLGLFFQK